MSRRLEIYTDGACSGNPGAASIAFVIKEKGRVIKEFAKFIGQATNNIAEYTALIYALQEALILRADSVDVFSDSELMCQQCKGNFKVKNPNIKPLFDQVQHLRAGFKSVTVTYIPREKNSDADALAKKILKKEQSGVVASSLFDEGEESPSSEG